LRKNFRAKEESKRGNRWREESDKVNRKEAKERNTWRKRRKDLGVTKIIARKNNRI
jgi:hypothetical protein